MDATFYAALLEDDPAELYEHAPCAYLSTLLDGTIVKVNRTFVEWTGYPPEQLLGRERFKRLLAPGDRIFYETHLVPLLHMQGQLREIAVELVGESGGRLPVILNSIVKNDAFGTPTLVRTAIFDARERRQYEQELMAARRRAEESEARARDLAHTLQASFLPAVVPSIPQAEAAGAYRPSGDGSEVGGDFYDLFEAAGGRWVIVVGDVAGKGIPAAVLTALARNTVRSEALHSPVPNAVLEGLHQAMLRYHPNDFCTCVVCTLDPVLEGVRLTIGAAGHPLPLRVRPDGSVDALGRHEPLIGMLPARPRVVTDALLEPGDVLVMYTDGVTEARRRGEFFGEGRLRSLLSEARHESAADIAEEVVRAVVEYQGGQTHDDIAVVAIRTNGA